MSDTTWGNIRHKSHHSNRQHVTAESRVKLFEAISNMPAKPLDGEPPRNLNAIPPTIKESAMKIKVEISLSKRDAFKELAQSIKAERGNPVLVDGGYLHMGKTVLGSRRVDIESGFETEGSDYRYILYEDDEIVFTTRIMAQNNRLYFASKTATMTTRKGLRITLSKSTDRNHAERSFADILELSRWMFQTCYDREMMAVSKLSKVSV